MIKTTEEPAMKIPILRCDGRQHLDFPAWKKAFSTIMSQKYGDLAQVFRTGEDFAYIAPERPSITVLESKLEEAAMDRGIYMQHIADHRINIRNLNTVNIQMYNELFSKLHEDTIKKIADDPTWAAVENAQNPKGLMLAVTKVIMMSSSGNKHQDTHRARMHHHALRQADIEPLQDYYARTNRSLSNQTSLGHIIDKDIDQALDFTYKLDRKYFNL